MKAIIVGGGEVGYHLADRLSKEGHDITLIEKDGDRESHLRNKVNAQVVLGSGASADVLESAGVAESQLFIAVTNVDEVNMVACQLANEYQVNRKIARLTSIEYAHSAGKLNTQKLGIDLLINPQFVVADEIVEVMEYTNAVEVAEFAGGQVLFLGYIIHEDNPVAGKTLKELALNQGDVPLVVTSINREERTIIPRGDDVIQEGDILSLVCRKKDLHNIYKLFGFKERATKNVFILGAGHVGFELARRLSASNHRVKIIDRNEKHCREISESLEDVLVLNTQSTDIETLKNEGISQVDVFAAVTDDDQSNILGSLLAKRYGAKRAITLVNQPELRSLAESLGIDACVSPRLATASAILKFIRRGKVLSMLEKADAEVLELLLTENSEILRKPIHSIGVPEGSTIGAIVRNGNVIIPGGSDQLEANDRVVVFTLLKAVPKVEKFFS